jgi:DNA polymerase-4
MTEKAAGAGSGHGASIPRQILYCRRPGLLAQAARAGRRDEADASPLAVADGPRVRDVCPLARSRGVAAEMSVSVARRLCPILLVAPLEAIDPRLASRAFLDRMAELSPIVEPDGPDAAYLDVTGLPAEEVLRRLADASPPLSAPGTPVRLPPVTGLGSSRLAARACAECGLPPDRLEEASVRWLWPEEEEVVARLRRLGLETFGQVAALSESALVYQFGRRGRLLFRRARGRDHTPVRARYPAPRAEVRRDFFPEGIDDRQRLQAVLARMSREAAGQLRHQGRVGHRVTLAVVTGHGEQRRESVLIVPVQEEVALLRAASRLLAPMTLAAPVISVCLRVEELSLPGGRSLDLFAQRRASGPVGLSAVVQALSARYGPRACMPLGPPSRRAPRDVRRQLLRDHWEREA